jgi:hypothetical protein
LQLVIEFSDVIGSTALGEEIMNEAMNEVRREHFTQSFKLIAQFKCLETKSAGRFRPHKTILVMGQIIKILPGLGFAWKIREICCQLI